MADLAELDRSEAVKIAGAAPSTGVTDNYVQVDSNGNMFTNLRTGAVEQIAQKTMVNSIPTVIASDQSAVGTAATTHTTQPVAYTDSTQNPITIDEFGIVATMSQAAIHCEWGKAFSVTTGFITAGATTSETPFLLIRNPNASGKTCKFNRIIVSAPSSGVVSYNMYMTPTITANGGALTVVGCRQTGQAGNVTLFNSLPSASANGTLFFSSRAGSAYPYALDFGRWLEANNNILITVIQSVNSITQAINVDFSEQ